MTDAAAHTCHAKRCETGCPPEKLMCSPHWSMVPADLRARVRAAFVPGQCAGLVLPSEEWHAAADAAIEAVAALEGLAPPRAPAPPHPLDGLLAISIHQPYAHFLAQDLKDGENRFGTFQVEPGQLARPVAFHATGRINTDEERAVLAAFNKVGALRGREVKLQELERGAIVGLGVLTQVVNVANPADPERLAICAESSPWVCGPVFLCFEGALAIRPVRVPGHPGLWPVEGAVLDAVKLHWAALTTPHGRAAKAYFVQTLEHWRAIRSGAPASSIPRRPSRAEIEAAEVAKAADGGAITGGAPVAAPPTEAPPLPEDVPGDGILLLDTETANSRPPIRLVELAIVRVRGDVEQAFSSLIEPPVPIEHGPFAVHGISDAQVAGQPRAAAVLGRIAPWLRGAVVVAHNVSFDKRVVEAEYRMAQMTPPSARWHCSLKAARRLLPGEPSHKLGDLARRLGVPQSRAHRALDDARLTLGVLRAIAVRTGLSLEQVVERGAPEAEGRRRGRGASADIDV